MINLSVEDKAYFERLNSLHSSIWPDSVPDRPYYVHGEASLSTYLQSWARQEPERTAIVFYGARISYAELNALSDCCAALLARHGVHAGDRVAVIMGNCPQFLIAFHGILKLGAVYVPVNPMFKEAELVHELGDAGARVAIAVDYFAPLLMAVKDRLGLESVFTTRLGEMLPAQPELSLPSDLLRDPVATPGTLDFLQELERCTASAPQVAPDLDAIAALNYTGGTTGLPKGCIHTQRHMLYTSAAACTAAGFIQPGEPTADNVMLSFIPLFWIAGENGGLLFPLFTGSTLVLLTRWDALAVMQAIERYRVRHCFMLVDNAVEILDHPQVANYDLKSLTTTRVSSFVKKLSLDIRRRWLALTGTVMAESSWGMTETNTSDTFTTGMQAGDMDLKLGPGFVGLPVPGTFIKICDFDTGVVKPIGEEGEIVVWSPSLFEGYWQHADATAEAIRGGWFHTGDIGKYDEHGYLHYLGRRKEMLKVRGMSVFPTEVEGLICMHPAVLGAAVVGRPDPDKGQVPVAFVRLKPGETRTAEELQTWCHEQMAVYKVPEVRIVEGWPMTDTGKIKKHLLQEAAASPSAH